MKGIDVNKKDSYVGYTALDYARNRGNVDIVEKLTFASMGDKMRQKANEQVAKLNRVEGMVKQWFRFYKCDDKNSNEYKSLEQMVEAIKILIKKRLPISDDLLLLCFNFELKKNKGNPLECSIWKTLYNTLNKALRIPLNRRNWLWFKQYIFGSSLWYQKIPEEQEVKIQEEDIDKAAKDEGNNKSKNENKKRLLYDLLIDMVAIQLKAQKNYLKPYIIKLENDDNKENYESWQNLKNYKQFIVTDHPQGIFVYPYYIYLYYVYNLLEKV